MTIKRFSIGECVFLLLICISLIPIIDGTINFGQAPIVSFIFSCFYFLILMISAYRRKFFIQNKLVFKVLFFWVLIMLVRTVEFNYDYFRGIFVSPYLFMPFTFPFIVGVFEFSDLKKCIRYIHLINILCIFFFVIDLNFNLSGREGAIGFHENLSHYLAFPNFLLMFYFLRLTSFQKITSIVVFIMGLLLSVYLARRSLSGIYMCAAMLAVILLIYQTRSVIGLFSLVFCLSIMIVAMYYLYSNGQDIYAGLLDRLYEESRGSVVYDFNKSMTDIDLVIGKGIGGSYYLLTSDMDESVLGSHRNIIESGFLNLILYGGYIAVFIFALIYVGAIYNGYFRSENMLAKAFATLLVLHLLEFYPAGILFFNIHFLLIWIGIAQCYNKKFLQLKD